MLLLWDGGGLLTPLAEAGVGALLLPHVAAPFTHRDAAQEEVAATRSLGLFLREDGSAGALAQVDLYA
jgi:hypothetical protein